MSVRLQLRRLDAIRDAGRRLMARDRLGRDVHPRGAPERLLRDRKRSWSCDWYAFLHAYAQVLARQTGARR